MLAHNNYGLNGLNQDQYDEFLGLGKKGKARRKARRARRQERKEIRFERRRLKNDDRRADTELKRNEIKMTNTMLPAMQPRKVIPPMAQPMMNHPQQLNAAPLNIDQGNNTPAQAGISTNVVVGLAVVLLVGGYVVLQKKKMPIPTAIPIQ